MQVTHSFSSKRYIQKFFVYLFMLLVAGVMASVFGALHNQISFTVSDGEYFTRFKFIQFNLAWAYRFPRVGAAWVGVLATWWFGLILASVLGLFGFKVYSPKRMAWVLFKAFCLVLAFCLLFSIGGLVYGYVCVTPNSVDSYARWIWPGVQNSVQFVRAGFMHNSSYLGGVLGIFLGAAFIWKEARALKRQGPMCNG